TRWPRDWSSDVCSSDLSRRLGSRRVVVYCSDRDVVAQINGEDDVPEEYVGPYLEVRALLHAYRAARVEPCPQGGDDALWVGAARDRKGTRLNSSHVAIA